MRKFFTCMGLFGALFLLAVAAPAQDKNRPNRPNNTIDKRIASAGDYVALAPMKEIQGHLLTFDGKVLTVRVEYQSLELKDQFNQNNRAGNRAYQQMVRHQQQMMRDYENVFRARTPAQQMQRMQQFMFRLQSGAYAGVGGQGNMLANSPFKPVMHAVDFELPIVDELRVTKATLSVEYDDKGNVVQYTAEELKKRRDPVQQGFGAKVEDVQVGMLVKLFLTRSKVKEDAAKAREEKIKQEKEKAKEDKEKAATDEKKTDEKKTDADTAKPAEPKADPKADPKPDPKADPKAEPKADPKADPKVAKVDEKAKVGPMAGLGGLMAEDQQVPMENRPQVRGLLILSDPDPAYLPKTTPEKKNKKNKN